MPTTPYTSGVSIVAKAISAAPSAKSVSWNVLETPPSKSATPFQVTTRRSGAGFATAWIEPLPPGFSALKAFQSIDKAAKSDVIHRNQAARHKSQIARAVGAMK